MKLIFKPEAEKKMAKIEARDIPKIKRRLASLLDDPLSGKLLSGEFSGIRSIRAWPLRILYSFNPKSQTITIETIDYRGQIYK